MPGPGLRGLGLVEIPCLRGLPGFPGLLETVCGRLGTTQTLPTAPAATNFEQPAGEGS